MAKSECIAGYFFKEIDTEFLPCESWLSMDLFVKHLYDGSVGLIDEMITYLVDLIRNSL